MGVQFVAVDDIPLILRRLLGRREAPNRPEYSCVLAKIHGHKQKQLRRNKRYPGAR